MKRGPKFQRSSATLQRFLEIKGLSRVPRGKVVDHKVPLWKGGTDTLRNLRLIKKSSHERKTAKEIRERIRRYSS
jgi:5-methylcytosine-specific restriction endonuclease McrA